MNIENDIKNGMLTVIMGPMYSGKTTKLLSLINKSNDKDKKIFKHKADDRYQLNNIISHDNKHTRCIPIQTIKEGIELIKNDKLECKDIFIDEGQFFNDILDGVDELLKMGKHIYISGLNGDYLQNPFSDGGYLKLCSKADDVIMLTSKCYICKEIAPFTKKISKDEVGNDQILVGSIGIYQPSCRKHLYENQK